MTEKQKPAGDEPKQGKVHRSPQKSTKSEVVKVAVVARRCAGESKASIAREEQIDRRTVDHILEESADDITKVILEAGLNHKELVVNHLKPLLEAQKGGLYGGKDNATILRTIKYINELKGVRAKRTDGHQTAGCIIRLELPPGTDEAKIAAVIASRRSPRQPGLGAPVHEDRG